MKKDETVNLEEMNKAANTPPATTPSKIHAIDDDAPAEKAKPQKQPNPIFKSMVDIIESFEGKSEEEKGKMKQDCNALYKEYKTIAETMPVEMFLRGVKEYLAGGDLVGTDTDYPIDVHDFLAIYPTIDAKRAENKLKEKEDTKAQPKQDTKNQTPAEQTPNEPATKTNKETQEGGEPSAETDVSEETNTTQINMVEALMKIYDEIIATPSSEVKSDNALRIIQSAIEIYKSRSRLQLAVPSTFIAAVKNAILYDVDCGSLAECYFKPVINWKTGETYVKFGFTYKGLMKLVREGRDIEFKAGHVYNCDKFEVEQGTEPTLKHVPNLTEIPRKTNEDITYFYATARMYDIDNPAEKIRQNVHFMSKADVDRIRDEYSEYDSDDDKDNFWDKEYIKMAYKTVLKQLIAYFDLTPRAKRAMAADETIKLDNMDADVNSVEAQLPINDKINNKTAEPTAPNEAVPK